MLHAVIAGILLAANAGGEGAKTLWLVQPLYPGQDVLVPRCEEAIAGLIAADAKGREIIGQKALAQVLTGQKPDMTCLTGDSACRDPADAFVASLGFERVVLIKAGQEESQFRINASSFVPATGEIESATGTGPALDKALLATVFKVVPLSSRLEVVTAPAGATVLIDGTKVGVTPYTGSIQLGQHVLKIELASHLSLERKLTVPARGALRLDERLQKVPARLKITAVPAQAEIFVDGDRWGTGKVDQGIQPGDHTLRLAGEGYFPLEETISIEPGETKSLDKSLTPTSWTAFRKTLSDAQENIYNRGSAVLLNFEFAIPAGTKLSAVMNPSGKPNKNNISSSSALYGPSLELHTGGRYFGLLVVGAGYLTASSDWKVDDVSASAAGVTLRAVEPYFRLALWRLSFAVQLGVLDSTVLWLTTKDTSNKYWVVDVMPNVQGSIRGYLVAGLFLEGGYKYGWGLRQKAPFQFMHFGVGYAY